LGLQDLGFVMVVLLAAPYRLINEVRVGCLNDLGRCAYITGHKDGRQLVSPSVPTGSMTEFVGMRPASLAHDAKYQNCEPA
jgi:hypothetical protein